jgi:hypothetical protein
VVLAVPSQPEKLATSKLLSNELLSLTIVSTRSCGGTEVKDMSGEVKSCNAFRCFV